jgi:GNAT superfamily N-acetyltransferase
MEIRRINFQETWAIRHVVMWPQEKMDYVKINDDINGIHFGTFEDGVLVSVISLFIEAETAQFRKFATLKEFQGKGIGSELLSFTINYCRNNGIKKLHCNARVEKTNFYKRFGLEESGKCFKKNGKQYIIMELLIP